jgi:uncharacterized protein YeaO (DUF488 family)
MAAEIRVRRVYDQPSPSDGVRVLVDRVWPRGLRKDDAKLDEWAKDLAPSTDLRVWYGHDPEKFSEFRRRYIAELDAAGPREHLDQVRALSAGRPVTLLTATRDVDISQAAVLAELLRSEGDATRSLWRSLRPFRRWLPVFVRGGRGRRPSSRPRQLGPAGGARR